MYGLNEIPLNLEEKDFKISITKNENGFEYYRESNGTTVEKLLFAAQDEILIAPVEPLNLPRQTAQFLMIELAREIMLQPSNRIQLYLTFPVEIGVFVGKKSKYEAFDVFTLTPLKYTLYGEPRNGVICKYWKSRTYLEEPKTDPLREGVLQLTIQNSSHDWVKVNKALFNGNGMKIYYNEKHVSMKAEMKILEEEAAEVEFINSPIHRDMKKAPELFTKSKLLVSSKKAVMLEGI